MFHPLKNYLSAVWKTRCQTKFSSSTKQSRFCLLHLLFNVKSWYAQCSKTYFLYPQNPKCIHSRVNAATFYVYEYYFHATYSAQYQIYIEAHTASSVINPQDVNCNVCRNIEKIWLLQASWSLKMSPLREQQYITKTWDCYLVRSQSMRCWCDLTLPQKQSKTTLHQSNTLQFSLFLKTTRNTQFLFMTL